MTRHHVSNQPLPQQPLCDQSHYAVIVEALKDVEIYKQGEIDCPSCLQRMADKHAQLARFFRDRLAALTSGVS